MVPHSRAQTGRCNSFSPSIVTRQNSSAWAPGINPWRIYWQCLANGGIMRRMELNRRHETSNATPRRESPPRTVITDLDFNLPVKPISELVIDAEFPRSAMGQHVDIGGYPGVVVEIVKSSIKVRSAEGAMMSYNYNA